MAFDEKQAEALLVDTGRRCCICGLLHDVQLHHIVHKADGGGDEIDNAIPLCSNCHTRTHASKGTGVITRAYTASELKMHREKAILREKGELGDRFPIYHILHVQNPNFTGRKQFLNELHEALTSGKAAAVTQAISGLGGVGKTQIATEFSYLHQDEFSVIWWVRAEESTTLASDYARLAERLGLPEAKEADPKVAVQAVRQWLERRGGWLLVFDNANQSGDIEPYIPHGGHGSVIITSRRQDWGNVARSLSVKKFERGESIDLLIRRTNRDDKDGADAVAKALGDFPLALAQAAAYMAASGRSFADYLELLNTRRSEVLKKGKASDEYTKTVATTWEISFIKLENDLPAAADLLNLCSFFAADDIPLDVLVEHADKLPERLASALKDPMELDDIKAALLRYSFIDVTDGTMSIHRLVQDVMRDRMPEDEWKSWADMAVELMNAAFPYKKNDVSTWPQSASLLPHALQAAGHADYIQMASESLGRLLNEVGLYLRRRAQFSDSRTCHERALAIGEKVYGPQHPEVATMSNNLGAVLQDVGDLAEARKAFERALAIGEKVYGPEHPNVATMSNNLGGVLQDMGDLAGARRTFERALAIDEKIYGLEHPSTATDVNNLGIVLRSQGDLAGARKAFERALAIGEKIYGLEHPTVAVRLNNLGLVLKDMGDLAGARNAFERALAIDEKAFGPDHPNVATVSSNLGDVLKDMGDLVEAREASERALAIDERVYGLDHPNVARDVNNLGGVLRAEGNLTSAKEAYERALRIFKAFLPNEHPNIVIVKENMAFVEAEIRIYKHTGK